MYKSEFKNNKSGVERKSRPYQTYSYYLIIPVFIILVFLLSLVGYNKGTFGTIVFVFVIFAHVWASKLDLVRKRKHVAPILMYVTQGLGVVLMVLLVTEVSANDIKKAYPTMKEDAKAARLEYQELRRSK
ncbi:hypothetical protein FGL73_09030 [Lactococcus lactis]|uniref:Uncharacterized protein n=1 Tax=Lactococcus lactis TaxID=1358 RepID=A0AAP8E2Y4_9LACT|nr:hypothetical protein BW154_00075 [Lactococcus lactis]QEA61601.1 hypothetical protein FGL73_09030 [Lactococcus lactis]